jgi:hypothetical protein
LLIIDHGGFHLKNLHQIKTPAALAVFGAFFVPEPLGLCVVLASVIWWSCGKTAMTPDVSIARWAERVQASLRRILPWVQHTILITFATCFLIGVLISVLSPSHRLQNRYVYGDKTYGKDQDGIQTGAARPYAHR